MLDHTEDIAKICDLEEHNGWYRDTLCTCYRLMKKCDQKGKTELLQMEFDIGHASKL